MLQKQGLSFPACGKYLQVNHKIWVANLMKKTCTGSFKMGMKYEKIVVEIIISLGTVLQWGKPSQ
jgi:hypothetical protein